MEEDGQGFSGQKKVGRSGDGLAGQCYGPFFSSPWASVFSYAHCRVDCALYSPATHARPSPDGGGLGIGGVTDRQQLGPLRGPGAEGVVGDRAHKHIPAEEGFAPVLHLSGVQLYWRNSCTAGKQMWRIFFAVLDVVGGAC